MIYHLFTSLKSAYTQENHLQWIETIAGKAHRKSVNQGQEGVVLIIPPHTSPLAKLADLVENDSGSADNAWCSLFYAFVQVPADFYDFSCSIGVGWNWLACWAEIPRFVPLYLNEASWGARCRILHNVDVGVTHMSWVLPRRRLSLEISPGPRIFIVSDS